MLKRVMDVIKKHTLIGGDEVVVVGISGGPDSVCLLHLLHAISKDLAFKIHAVHINHMLRGLESDEDEKYVKALCENLEIPLSIKAVDIKAFSKKRGISLEEAGREVRYAAFEEIAGDIGAAKIVVAHNKNDQAETILMHILRGTGLDGLTGMNYIRGKIIRPLLDSERKEIESYCKHYALNPRTDSSNLETIFTRNKIRLELLPQISQSFGINTVDSLIKMAKLIKDDVDFIEESITNFYNDCILNHKMGSIILDIRKISTYHDAVKKRVIRRAIKALRNDLNGFESIHIEKIIDLAQQGRTSATIHLPNSIHATKSYDSLEIFVFKEKDHEEYSFNNKVKIPGEIVISSLGYILHAALEEKSLGTNGYFDSKSTSTMQFFDYEKLNGGISIRNRQEGDVFKPLKSNGTKKLKEYFIDKKIPRDKRDEIPLIAQGNEIVWVIGDKISDKFKVTENTKIVLTLKLWKGAKQ